MSPKLWLWGERGDVLAVLFDHDSASPLIWPLVRFGIRLRSMAYLPCPWLRDDRIGNFSDLT